MDPLALLLALSDQNERNSYLLARQMEEDLGRQEGKDRRVWRRHTHLINQARAVESAAKIEARKLRGRRWSRSRLIRRDV